MTEEKLTFRVRVATRGYEIWIVDAATAEDAADNFFNGEMIISEVLDTEVIKVDDEP